jgi:hypothetical protein
MGRNKIIWRKEAGKVNNIGMQERRIGLCGNEKVPRRIRSETSFQYVVSLSSTTDVSLSLIHVNIEFCAGNFRMELFVLRDTDQ